MSKQVTEYVTGIGHILFMAAAKPLTNQRTGKTEYSIKMKFVDSDPCISHLSDIASYKIDTKTNRELSGTGEMVVSFNSEFAPKIVGADNTVLEGSAIPFFDGRIDKGTAVVSYKVIDYGNNKIVRLSGIKLVSLDLAVREGSSGDTIDQTLEKLKNIG